MQARRVRGPSQLVAPSRALLSAPALVCIGMLLANDHYLKAEFPGALTGKLSDFAGLFFAPYLVLALLERVRVRTTTFVAAAVYVVIAVGFAALKVSEVSNGLVLGVVQLVAPLRSVVDPSDLVALAVLPMSFAQLRRRGTALADLASVDHRGSVSRPLRWSVAAIAVFATVATSSAKPTISHIASDAVTAGTVYVSTRYSQADGIYMTADAGSTWKRVASVTGSIITDPGRAGLIYSVDGDSWDPALYRIDVTNASVRSIKPASPGVRPQVLQIHGMDGLAVGAWPARYLFFVRNGIALVSRDEGATWSVLDVPGYVQAISTTAAANVVYVVAGRGHGSGLLYRSDDAGASWRVLNDVSVNFAKLAVDPRDAQLVFVAFGKSLYRSTDAGSTWSEAYRYVGGGSEEFARWLIEFDPSSDRIYMAFGFGCCRLMSSADRGITWTDTFIDSAHVSVDVGGNVFVVGPAMTQIYVSRGAPPWTETHSRVPLAP